MTGAFISTLVMAVLRGYCEVSRRVPDVDLTAGIMRSMQVDASGGGEIDAGIARTPVDTRCLPVLTIRVALLLPEAIAWLPATKSRRATFPTTRW